MFLEVFWGTSGTRGGHHAHAYGLNIELDSYVSFAANDKYNTTYSNEE